MKNTKLLFAALAIALVFGLASCGSKDSTDPALNGTWASADDPEDSITFNNGTFEVKRQMKGTYTTSGNKITMTMTHMWGTPMGLDAKWYSKSELLALPGLTDDLKEIINEGFATQEKATYSISGSTLTITSDFNPDSPETLIKQ